MQHGILSLSYIAWVNVQYIDLFIGLGGQLKISAMAKYVSEIYLSTSWCDYLTRPRNENHIYAEQIVYELKKRNGLNWMNVN